MITNVSKYSCAFSDFPWPEDTPMFPKGSSLCQYMKDYSEHFGVTKYIEFHSTVNRVERTNEGKFKVFWSQQSGNKELENIEAECEHLIIGSGLFGYPNIDKLGIPGIETFQGLKVHSSEYKDPHDFRGKKVLVVGGCISGV